MDNNPFNVFGSAASPCIGRANDKARVARLVAKNHVSIVGPRYIGKTVFARDLCNVFSKGTRDITGSTYWDLGHKTPLDDASFYAQFASVLARGIQNASPEAAEKLAAATDNFHEEIHDVLDYLHGLGLCFVICLDSFDDLLRRGTMTANLWDNLGALADDFTCVRYLAISRKVLNELCWVPGSENSHFWKLFGTSPQLLKSMTLDDIQGFAQPFIDCGLSIRNGFTTELLNWSGGIPLMLATLCRDIWDAADRSSVLDNELVNRTAGALLNGSDTMLAVYWRSLSGEQQRFVVELGENGKELEVAPAARPLINAQLMVQDGKRLHVPSRLLRRYAASAEGRAGGYLREFFESEDAYARNIRTVLEFRLAQLSGTDRMLHAHVADMVEKLDEPDIVIGKPRLILNRAFELIWLREFGEYQVPGEWLREFSKLTDKMPSQRIPSEVGGQCRILELMTDENCALPSHISRYTYHLLNGLRPVSNTGAHLRGERQGFGYSVAITFWCLQLVEQISKELAA